MTRRASLLPDLSPSALRRLRRRHADGAPFAVIARELGVSTTMLKRHLKATVSAASGTVLAIAPAKPTRPVKMPHTVHAPPPRPVSEFEPSKERLRAELARAFANTPHH